MHLVILRHCFKLPMLQLQTGTYILLNTKINDIIKIVLNVVVS